MLASANGISESAVGLVYLCAVAPGICLKATAPYWFHRVNYSSRVIAAALLMAGSYTTVAAADGRRPMQLIGVVLSSIQGSLGEASCLALTSHYNSKASITMWSSGTGFAGVFGYAWVAFFHLLGGLSFQTTLLAANSTVIAWVFVYFFLLEPPEGRSKEVRALVMADEHLVEAAMEAMGSGRSDPVPYPSHSHSSSTAGSAAPKNPGDSENDVYEYTEIDDAQAALLEPTSDRLSRTRGSAPRPASPLGGRFSHDAQGKSILSLKKTQGKGSKAHRMTPKERFTRTLALWPYTVPLFLVYFAEYAMQSGTWAAMGFPVTVAESRHTFYIYANWSYQVGVFLSRSSGMVWQANRKALWIMPVAQVGWLLFFVADAVGQFWWNWGLLGPCFITGLLGGAVYVNAFNLIAREVEPQYREFSLAAASVADSAGVAVADVAGIIIQGCLFKVHGLQGADFAC